MKFSPSNLQFYPDDIGYEMTDVPGDVIDVPPEDFAAAMDRAPGSCSNLRMVVSLLSRHLRSILLSGWSRLNAIGVRSNLRKQMLL